MFLTCEFSSTLLTPCTSNPVKKRKKTGPHVVFPAVRQEWELSLRVSQWDEDVKILSKYEVTSLQHQRHPLQKSTLTVQCPSDK